MEYYSALKNKNPIVYNMNKLEDILLSGISHHRKTNTI